ncbi:MAG: D-Ala-D-Ala carboxypeptidase family metallohydrolase [Cyanobacteria bacterium P01_F01_bin.150]
MKITATQETYLKKDPAKQASELLNDQKVLIEAGKEYVVETQENENDDDQAPSSNGHALIAIGYGAGDWWIYPPHWHFESQVIVDNPPSKIPEWDEVDWTDWSAPVSKYFTVGEVTNLSTKRIPKDDWDPFRRQSMPAKDIKQNIVRVARKVDDVREWWGGPLAVTSWLRPWQINIAIGSKAPNHPYGYGVDFRPMNGSVWDMQARFERELYNTGKWDGGFGRGAKKGFIHVDLRHRRVWNY